MEERGDLRLLDLDDIVEISGFVDNAGRIRATYIFSVPPPMPPPVNRSLKSRGSSRDRT